METVPSSKTSVDFYPNKRRCIPQNSPLLDGTQSGPFAEMNVFVTGFEAF
jgi:hypothetical protein